MEVEREMAEITLPFAAGVAAVVFFKSPYCDISHIPTGLAYLVTLATTILLLHPLHKTFSPAVLRTIIITSLVSCGIFCGLAAEIISIGTDSEGGVMKSIETLGLTMGKAIDRIGFRSPDTNALVKALIVGDRSDIPRHITDAFRESGASHILALSGLHLGIIYGLIYKVLSFSGNTPAIRKIRSVVIILSCGIYTLSVGAGASIVRAYLFIVLGEAARLGGRSTKTGNILMAALFIHLVLDPAALQEAGFQLSYAAMAGIAFIFPHLKGFWPCYDEAERKTTSLTINRPKFLKWIWTTAALSISCQVTTAPIAFLHFNTFPVHFLLTNLIALPLTSMIIPLSLMTLTLSSLGICPEIISRATEALVTALSEALEIISTM